MVHDFIPKQRISFALHVLHGLHCPVVLIPSLALKKLSMRQYLLCLSASAAAKRAFSILGGAGAVR
jgi:hypothetical protein